jgi:hypothetical protein
MPELKSARDAAMGSTSRAACAPGCSAAAEPRNPCNVFPALELDAKAKRIDYTFWANDGTYGTATAYFEGDSIIHVSARPPGSKAAEMRSVWRRIDADTFEVTREKKHGEAWEPVFSVTYRRVGK